MKWQSTRPERGSWWKPADTARAASEEVFSARTWDERLWYRPVRARKMFHEARLWSGCFPDWDDCLGTREREEIKSSSYAETGFFRKKTFYWPRIEA
jgi:hypothetical protein